MILANSSEISKIMVGTKEVDRVMAGPKQVWPTGPWFCTDFTKGKMDGWYVVNGSATLGPNGLTLHSGAVHSAIEKRVDGFSEQDVYSLAVSLDISDSLSVATLTLGESAYFDENRQNTDLIVVAYYGMVQVLLGDFQAVSYFDPFEAFSKLDVQVYKNHNVTNVDVYVNETPVFSRQSSLLNLEVVGLTSTDSSSDIDIKRVCLEEFTPFDVARYEFRTFTSAGTHSQSIPSWATGFAYLMIGGGGGGGGGDGALGRHGNGGKRGQFQSGYQALGPGAVANVSVGAGGSAGAKEKNGGPGGISTISGFGTGYGINLAASGGSGGSGYGGAAGEDTVASRYYNDYLNGLPNATYLPYATSAGNNTDGDIPGGGGGPGAGGVFGSARPGRVGGRGEVHMMFYDQKFAQIYDLPIGTR